MQYWSFVPLPLPLPPGRLAQSSGLFVTNPSIENGDRPSDPAFLLRALRLTFQTTHQSLSITMLPRGEVCIETGTLPEEEEDISASVAICKICKIDQTWPEAFDMSVSSWEHDCLSFFKNSGRQGVRLGLRGLGRDGGSWSSCCSLSPRLGLVHGSKYSGHFLTGARLLEKRVFKQLSCCRSPYRILHEAFGKKICKVFRPSIGFPQSRRLQCGN